MMRLALSFWLLLTAAAPAQGLLTPQPDPDAPPAEADEPKFKRVPFSLTGPHLPVPIDGIDTEARPGVVLRELDKLTGLTREVTIPVGAQEQVQRLAIRVAACRAPADGSDRGTVAWLEIRDTKTPDRVAFAGWMFADSPALSALDHPRFDVWVISCTTSSG